MTHHPNTPASRNEAAATSTTLLDIHRALGAYGNARACLAMDAATLKAEVMCLVEAAIASRTEQAAPSVASGAVVDVRRLAAEARANPGIEVALSEGTANAFRDALAAPGAAIAAREQEPFNAEESRKRGIDYFAERYPALKEALVAEKKAVVTPAMIAAGLQTANVLDPVLSTLYPSELTAVYQAMHAMRPFAQPAECTTCGALVVGVASRPEAPPASASSATVAQPVGWQVRGIGREDGPGEWRYADEEDIEAYRNTPDTWELRPVFAQPCPSQGCGGDGGVGAPFGIIDPDYARIFTKARILAWQYGYALVMHGSFTRDLDLLLVPWEQRAFAEAVPRIVKMLAEQCDLKIRADDPTDKPHGRKCWSLHLPGFGEPRWVDLSVMPAPIALSTDKGDGGSKE